MLIEAQEKEPKEANDLGFKVTRKGRLAEIIMEMGMEWDGIQRQTKFQFQIQSREERRWELSGAQNSRLARLGSKPSKS